MPHATRWQLDLPDRAGTFGYMADVLARQEDLLGGAVDDGARYFYELAIRHEDMHVEALTYTRQTLGYAPPNGLGDARRPAAGALPGDVAVPGGRLAAGIDRRATASSSTTRSGRTRRRWRPSASPARRSPTPSSRPSSRPAATARREFWSDAGWAWRRAPRRRASGLLAAASATACGRSRRYRAGRGAGAARAGRVRQLVRGRRLVPLGRPAPADRGRVGAAASACRRPTARASPKAAGAFLGATRRPTPERANLDCAFDGPIDVAACAAGDSAFGCRQMIGNVWEWTATDFLPFPASPPIPTRSTRSPGSARTRCCAAAAGRPARASPARPSATSSRPTAATSSPASAPARFENPRVPDSASQLNTSSPIIRPDLINAASHDARRQRRRTSQLKVQACTSVDAEVVALPKAACVPVPCLRRLSRDRR